MQQATLYPQILESTLLTQQHSRGSEDVRARPTERFSASSVCREIRSQRNSAGEDAF